MRKNIIALSVLGLMTSAASAASSITFYGKVEAAYQGSNTSNHSYNGPGVCPADAICIQGFPSYDIKNSKQTFTQSAEGESRIGIKGNEDLGNGTAAFFQLESKINGDTGSVSGSDFFGEKSVVGLSFGNGKHSIYFGRSASPIDRIGFSMDHLSSGLSWKSSTGNWKNAAFYDYSANGLSVMAAMTTKGGLNAQEGNSTLKSAYGISTKYTGTNFAIAAAYQRDHNDGRNGGVSQLCTLGAICPAVPDLIKSEWGVGAQYSFNPVTISASYADAKHMNLDKTRRIHATISAKLSGSDTLFVNYLRANRKNDTTILQSFGSPPFFSYPSPRKTTQTHFGIGYVHALSKRSEFFANVGLDKTSTVVSGSSSTSHVKLTTTAFDLGFRHSF